MKIMFKMSVIVVIAISWLFTANAQESAVKTDSMCLTLDECLRIALNENPTIRVADMEIQRVDYSKKEILGQLLPSVSFGGQYNRTLARQTMHMNFNGQSQSIKVGSDNSYNLGFNASVPIIAPQLWKSLKLSDNQILQNVETARSSRISLINQVQKAYYSLLYAKDALSVLKDNHATAMLNADIYKKKFETGTASEYDVLRSSVQVKNLEPSILDAENSISQAKLQLKLLMGMDMALNIDVRGQLSDYQSNLYDQTMLLNPSLQDNTSLRSLDLKTDYLQKALDVQKMAWYPTLSGNINYSWTSLSDGSPFKNFQWNAYSVAGLTLSIPIFQGGIRYNKQKQAEISLREMKWQRDNLERSLKLQVQTQYDNIQKSVKQITTNELGVQQAEKANQIMEKSFRIGAASYLDLRDSENALLSAKLAYYQSIYSYLVAHSDLKYVLGNTDLNQYAPALPTTENNK